MRELFGKRHFIFLYSFLMELINLPNEYENALKPFYDTNDIRKRMVFLKLMDCRSVKWMTNDYVVIVDTLNFMLGQAVEHRDAFDKCFYHIDKMMRKEPNYFWNRESCFVLKKILDAITIAGNYNFTFENWDGDYILIFCDDK